MREEVGVEGGGKGSDKSYKEEGGERERESGGSVGYEEDKWLGERSGSWVSVIGRGREFV